MRREKDRFDRRVSVKPSNEVIGAQSRLFFRRIFVDRETEHLKTPDQSYL